MNESLRQHLRELQEKHLHFPFWVPARQRGADVRDRTAKGVPWPHRIGQREGRIHQASTLLASAHSPLDSAGLVQAQDCRAGTFPHNQSTARVKLEPEAPTSE